MIIYKTLSVLPYEKKWLMYLLSHIDSMQFVNSSLEKLVKSLSDNDFKYLIKEFGSKHLDLLKQKDAYPYEHMNKFERFSEKKILTKNVFTDP